MIKLKISFIALLFITSLLTAKAQNPYIYIKRVTNSELEIYNQNNMKKGDVSSNTNYLWDVTVSPSGDYISLIEIPKDVTKSSENNFKILSKDGIVLHDLKENVRKYRWNSKGDKLAIIAGQYYEGGVGFKTEKVFIYDLKDRSKTTISSDLVKEAYQLSWSPDDSKIYIQTLRYRTVYEYDLIKKEVIKTNFQGIYFSPDGKYYYHESNPVRDLEFAVFSTTTNKKVQLNNALKTEKYGKILGWAPNKEHALLYKELHEDIEYKDHVITRDKNGEPEYVLRDYLNREVIGITYKHYDVALNKETKTLKTNGVEHKLIKSDKIFLYQKNGTKGFILNNL